MNSLVCVLSAALVVATSHGYPLMAQPNVVGENKHSIFA